MKREDFNQIIIGGLQRSGTSLTRAIVGSHPQIAIYQWDLGWFTIYYPKYGLKVFNLAEAVEFYQSLLKDPKVDLCDIKFNLEEFKEALTHLGSNEISFSNLYMIFMNLYREKIGRDIVGLKTPFNEDYVEEIFELFPNTKFIQVVRNPLDVAVSLAKARKNWGSFKMQTNEHIKKWKSSVSNGFKYEKAYKGQYKMVKYEDIVDQPEVFAKQIAEFLGVPYNEAMLRMDGQIGWRGSNSSFGDNGKNTIHKTAINRYKELLDKKTQMKYAYFLNEFMHKMGYSLCESNYSSFKKQFYPILYTSDYLRFVLPKRAEIFIKNVIPPILVKTINKLS